MFRLLGVYFDECYKQHLVRLWLWGFPNYHPMNTLNYNLWETCLLCTHTPPITIWGSSHCVFLRLFCSTMMSQKHSAWSKSLTCPLGCRVTAWGAEPKCCFKVHVKVMRKGTESSHEPNANLQDRKSGTLTHLATLFLFMSSCICSSITEECCPGVLGDTLIPPGFFNQPWDFYHWNKARLCIYLHMINHRASFPMYASLKYMQICISSDPDSL